MNMLHVDQLALRMRVSGKECVAVATLRSFAAMVLIFATMFRPNSSAGRGHCAGSFGLWLDGNALKFGLLRGRLKERWRMSGKSDAFRLGGSFCHARFVHAGQFYTRRFV